MDQHFPTIDPKTMRRTLWQRFWYRILRLLGWDLTGGIPDLPKYVFIVAHHTSNWDLPIGYLVRLCISLPGVRWFAKSSLFWGPFGAILTWLGAFPIERSTSHSYVEQFAAEFARRDKLILTLAPEGTRRKTGYWKSGFYQIALAANVPIAAGFIDFERKLAGVGPIFMPSGNVDADMEMLRNFYATVRGLHPESQGVVRLRSDEKS